MTTMKTSEVLLEAARLIDERGWAKGGGWHPQPGDTGPVCVEGAFNALLGRRMKFECPVWRAFGEYLSTRDDVHINPASGLPVQWYWNDHPRRTAEEVTAALRAAALIEAAREEARILGEREEEPADCELTAVFVAAEGRAS